MSKAHEELIEECARAICSGCEGNVPWERCPESYREGYRSSARAALAVVWRRAQKVTPEMLEAWVEGEEWDATGVYLSTLRAGPLNPEGE